MSLFFNIEKTIEKARKSISRQTTLGNVHISYNELSRNYIKLEITYKESILFIGSRYPWNLVVIMHLDYSNLNSKQIIRKIVDFTNDKKNIAEKKLYNDSSFYLYYPGKYFNSLITFHHSDTRLGTVRIKNNNGIERILDFAIDINGLASSIVGFGQLLDRIRNISDTGYLEQSYIKYITNYCDIKQCEKIVIYNGSKYKLYDFRIYHREEISDANIEEHIFFVPNTPNKLINYIKGRIREQSNCEIPDRI